VSTAALVGCIFGQLLFGFLGDFLGRQLALTLTILTTVFGAIATTLCNDTSSDMASIFIPLAIFRFVLGMGVGGVYPLAAVIAGEGASSSRDDGYVKPESDSANGEDEGVDKKAHVQMAMVFSTQGLGLLSPPLLALILLSAGCEEKYAWRILLGVGAVPGIIVFILSFFIGSKLELPKFCRKQQVSEIADFADDATAETAGEKLKQQIETIFNPTNLKMLIGTAGSWMLFDFCFYGNNLFKGEVMELIFPDDNNTTSPDYSLHTEHMEEIYKDLICAAIALPGYYVATLLMGRFGLKFIQEQGFFFMAFLFAVLAIFVNEMKTVWGGALVVIVYGLTFFSSNFGPNTITFLLPAATFPSAARSTLNGISAASGKVGATIGSSCFKPLLTVLEAYSMKTWGTEEHGVQFIFGICAVVAALGGLLTVFFVKGSILPNKKDLTAPLCGAGDREVRDEDELEARA
jgi:PHS family inorganic phosphate transporter-like MFS transporter